MKEKTRQSNFEVLRIVAMLMVVTMHYLMKGKAAVSLEEDLSMVNLAAWLVQSACIVAVNVYVLISGYFLIDTGWSMKKLLRVILQILSYSLLVPIVCLFLGIADVAEWNLYDWATVIFPLQMEHYWFATAYVIMYLLTPVIKSAVRSLGEKELRTVILLLLVFFCLGKSVIPIFVATDKYGYDFGWFLCLYLIAAYIRLYGIPWFNRIRKGLFLYLIFVGIIFSYSIVLGYLSSRGLPLSYAMDMNYSYNHILVLAASVGLFYGFKYMRFKPSSPLGILSRIAPYTFGVYLLHENIAIRDLWQSFAGVEAVRGSFAFLPHMVVTVTAVLALGIFVDFSRSCLFLWVGRVIKGKRPK